MKTHDKKAGFSLIELSIVLVIIGLLIGGVLAGQSLMRSAELRAFSTEYQRYTSAVLAFRNKYNAIPGDMSNATTYWGTDTNGCPGVNTTTMRGHTTTCDGDGNSMIEPSAASSNEMFRFWQHLSNAGMIEGRFSGITGDFSVGSNIAYTAGLNIPKSRLADAQWTVTYVGSRNIASGFYFDGEYDNAYIFGKGIDGTQPVLKPEEAWNLDTKFDDGKPGLGVLTTAKSSTQANASTGCSNVNYTTGASIAATSDYLLTNKSVICTLIIKTQM